MSEGAPRGEWVEQRGEGATVPEIPRIAHAEDIARALSRKHFGLMNMNKGIQAVLGSSTRRDA